MNLFFGKPLEHFLIISAILFCLGIYTAMTRRNAVGILMGVELMLNAANLNLVGFSKFRWAGISLDGEIFVIFIIILAAAEAAVALAIILSIFRNFGDVDVDTKDTMKE